MFPPGYPNGDSQKMDKPPWIFHPSNDPQDRNPSQLDEVEDVSLPLLGAFLPVQRPVTSTISCGRGEVVAGFDRRMVGGKVSSFAYYSAYPSVSMQPRGLPSRRRW
eukprot:GHVS01001624.1.p1 GENE.GHVS01001624.1~~GHVS01001624.1.p1  ORF type:complete len:106 (-),score=16.35 GHVS01001624.1:106-423(-)